MSGLLNDRGEEITPTKSRAELIMDQMVYQAIQQQKYLFEREAMLDKALADEETLNPEGLVSPDSD